MDWNAVPLHTGKPWFLPMVGTYYRLKDMLRQMERSSDDAPQFCFSRVFETAPPGSSQKYAPYPARPGPSSPSESENAR
ncbi:hypothetical protein MES5069_460041 [Mesorhizobium escarrei]|uniref:Uncharacterized protein n=1 Tax=Mesorhizobium escarrei TaxID=666018 RepID=A0ABM9E7X8_9HYPH|nr:hypothetical protein MES5069_460041 [Mesorhizobium escarrei]